MTIEEQLNNIKSIILEWRSRDDALNFYYDYEYLNRIIEVLDEGDGFA